MNQVEKSIAITGPREGVGHAVADLYAHRRHGINLILLGSRDAPLLEQMGKDFGASETVGGDIFDPLSDAYKRAMSVRPNVLVQNAAFNMDTMTGDKATLATAQILSRERQTAYFKGLIEAQIAEISHEARLLINVNSVTSLSERGASKYPYMGMKRDQALYAEGKRAALKNAGVELVQLRPGAIRTSMMDHIPDDARAVALANLLMKRETPSVDRVHGYEQDSIFQPKEIAAVIAQLGDHFFEHGEIPPHLRDIVITHHDDLQLDFNK